MSKSLNKISLLTGTVLALGTVSSASLAADVNPFGMTELSGGYTLTVADAKCGGKKSANEAKCGEGKCGDSKAKKEAKCGEGKCGGDKAKKEAKCGGNKAKKEAKCGEGKCGGSR